MVIFATTCGLVRLSFPWYNSALLFSPAMTNGLKSSFCIDLFSNFKIKRQVPGWHQQDRFLLGKCQTFSFGFRLIFFLGTTCWTCMEGSPAALVQCEKISALQGDSHSTHVFAEHFANSTFLVLPPACVEPHRLPILVWFFSQNGQPPRLSQHKSHREPSVLS